MANQPASPAPLVPDNSTLEQSGATIREKDGGTTNAKLADMANKTFKGRHSAGTGVPEDVSAANVVSDLNLVIGTNVEAWSANLDTLAGLTPTTNNFIISFGSAWASRTPAQAMATLSGAAAADFSLNSHKITSVTDPTSAQDAATKSYVDALVQGITSKHVATVATAATLPAYTYLAGVITFTATGTETVDGSVVALNDYILVKNETAGNAPYNGLYKATTAGAVGVLGVWTRSTDMDSSAEFPGAFVFVEQGSTLASTGWVCTNSTPPTVGTDAITFVQFSGAGTYTADESTLHLSGSTFSIISTYVGQTSITTLGTISTGTWQGTPIANAFLANSSLTVTASTGLTGGGSVSLGGSTSLAIDFTRQNTWTGEQKTTLTDALQSSSVEIAAYTHRSSGTPATGFGLAIDFNLDDSTKTVVNSGAIISTWATATHGSALGRVAIWAQGTGLTFEGIRVECGASSALLGFFAATAVAQQTGDVGTGLVNFGLFSGTPTFAAANITGTLTVGHGGSGAATFTAHGVLLGNGASAFGVTAVGATNTVLHGNTGADPSFSAVVEADLSLTDVTTANVSTSAHGFAPKAPNDASRFLDGTGNYSTPTGSGGGSGNSGVGLRGNDGLNGAQWYFGDTNPSVNLGSLGDCYFQASGWAWRKERWGDPSLGIPQWVRKGNPLIGPPGRPGRDGKDAIGAGGGGFNAGMIPTGWVKLFTTTIGSAVSSVDFTNLTGYKLFHFEIQNLVPVTDAQDQYIRFSTNGGVTFDSSSNYTYATVFSLWTGASGGTGSGGTTQLDWAYAIKNSAGIGASGNLTLNPGSAANQAAMYGTTTGFQAGANGGYTGATAGMYGTVGLINGVRFLSASGNLNAGTITVYGLNN